MNKRAEQVAQVRQNLDRLQQSSGDERTRLIEHIRTFIQEASQTESQEILEQEKIDCDCLIIGTGPAGVSMASSLSTHAPESKLLMADEQAYRGGLFAAPGYNFKLNTPQKGPIGFAKELPSPNHLGPDCALQLSDISTASDYADKASLAFCLQVNGFLAAPAILSAQATHIDIPKSQDQPNRVHFLNKETGQSVHVHAPYVVIARGRGKAKIGLDISQHSENIHISEDFNTHIDSLNPQEVHALISKGLAIVGGGDSASTALEAILNKLLTNYTPEQIKELNIDVFGTKYTGPHDFEAVTRIPRYNALIPYIGSFIRPHTEKIDALIPVMNRIGLISKKDRAPYGTVAVLTGYSNSPIEDMVNAQMEELREAPLGLIARKAKGAHIYQVGVDLPEQFPGTPPVFSKSIVRQTPRTLAAAQRLIQELQNKWTG